MCMANEGNCEKYAICLFNTKAFKETKDFITSIHIKYPKNDLLNRLLGRSLLNLNSHVEGLKYLQSRHSLIETDRRMIRNWMSLNKVMKPFLIWTSSLLKEMIVFIA